MPERPGYDAPWKVVAPRRYASGLEQLIGSLLSEEDARAIAVAHPAMDLVQAILEGLDLDSIRRLAKVVMDEYEGSSPALEDEVFARHTRHRE